MVALPTLLPYERWKEAHPADISDRSKNFVCRIYLSHYFYLELPLIFVPLSMHICIFPLYQIISIATSLEFALIRHVNRASETAILWPLWLWSQLQGGSNSDLWFEDDDNGDHDDDLNASGVLKAWALPTHINIPLWATRLALSPTLHCNVLRDKMYKDCCIICNCHPQCNALWVVLD